MVVFQISAGRIEDLENGGSDRLLDAIFAMGNLSAVERRIQSHIDAGANEICLYPVNPHEKLEADQVAGLEPEWEAIEALAPAAS